jgi:nicotinamide-nucleotide amidase
LVQELLHRDSFGVSIVTAMRIEIINTGTELMLGGILNTHQQWLCRRLTALGYIVARQTAVADRGDAIMEAVREALGRADLVITTGGLGPTSDDITRDLIAEMVGKKLVVDENVMERIENYFASRKRRMPESTKRQAEVPESSIVFQNDHGTAPGLAIEASPKRWLVLLPGPPRELRPMFDKDVVGFLSREFPTKSFVCRTLNTTGLGESFVEEKIDRPLAPLVEKGLELGYCARIGLVTVRFVAHGDGAEDLVANAEAIVRRILGPYIFSSGEQTIEESVVQLLTEEKKTVAVAESCTGGLICNRLTNVPGASAVLMAGMVTYSNESKQRLLRVHAQTLAAHGAVSEQVAREMAEGARKETGTHFGIAVTGIAGPGGGSAEKPVGTVFIAIADEKGTTVQQQFYPFDRETFKYAVSQQALDLLRRKALGRE